LIGAGGVSDEHRDVVNWVDCEGVHSDTIHRSVQSRKQVKCLIRKDD
jgi:hypothetical protein